MVKLAWISFLIKVSNKPSFYDNYYVNFATGYLFSISGDVNSFKAIEIAFDFWLKLFDLNNLGLKSLFKVDFSFFSVFI